MTTEPPWQLTRPKVAATHHIFQTNFFFFFFCHGNAFHLTLRECSLNIAHDSIITAKICIIRPWCQYLHVIYFSQNLSTVQTKRADSRQQCAKRVKNMSHMFPIQKATVKLHFSTLKICHQSSAVNCTKHSKEVHLAVQAAVWTRNGIDSSPDEQIGSLCPKRTGQFSAGTKTIEVCK